MDDEDDYVSKSQRKRESAAAQKIGEQLISLKTTDLDEITLPDDLRQAVLEARKLKSNGALKRQKQYIGKLMREADANDIAKQLQHIQHRHDYNVARFKRVEQWRDDLIKGDKNTLTEIIDRHPDIDRQLINRLCRQATKELTTSKPPAASRKLFKYLLELEENQ